MDDKQKALAPPPTSEERGRALKAMQSTAEYEAADKSVGLQAGWTFAVSDNEYNTIKAALTCNGVKDSSGWQNIMTDTIETTTALQAAREVVRLQSRLTTLEAQVTLMRDVAEKMAGALGYIATTEYCQYKDGVFVSDHDSGYKMGVAAGHRLAATWAREALTEWQKISESQDDTKEGK